MRYTYEFRQDYDDKFKYHKDDIFCYSKKKMRKLHPDGAYNVIGEIDEHNRKEEKDQDELSMGSRIYKSAPLGKHSSFCYRKIGYVSVGDDKYVLVLESRVPFLIVLFLLLGALIAAGLTTYFLVVNPDTSIVRPVNPLPKPDENTVPIEDDDSTKTPNESGGGSVTLVYNLDAELHLSTGKIKIFYANPNSSNHSVVLELYVIDGEDEILIAKSGLVKPGFGLEELEFDRESAILQEGSYDAKYKLLYYDETTPEKALVETDLPDVDLKVYVN